MKTLIFGANGFVGAEVSRRFKLVSEVIQATRAGDDESIAVDMFDIDAVKNAIHTYSPDLIINCAGVLSVNDNADLRINSRIVTNILDGVSEYTPSTRVILIGSAASYGIIQGSESGAVSEAQPLAAVSGYGFSKRLEEETALSLADDKGLDVVIIRLFNCIGLGMKDRFLLPSLVKQVDAVTDGQGRVIRASRFDAVRDYIDVRDVAEVIWLLSTKNELKHRVYNLGSGTGVSTEKLLDLILDIKGISSDDVIKENISNIPEPSFAMRADMSRIFAEFDWRPKISLKQTLEEVIKDDK